MMKLQESLNYVMHTGVKENGMTVYLSKVSAWVTEHKRILKAAIMAFLPLLCCVVACAAQGRTIGEVSIAAGEWNDELFYFKQVEGIVHHGYPLGYFGFNESHALKASFAAWSPVLVFPWIIWGLLFGWSFSSPIYCNIFLMMLAMFLFVWLAKPGGKQLGILTILFVTFTPFTRYMLSAMPECICFALVIIVLALDISYLEKEHPAKLVLLFLLTAVLTLMRPYLLLFMLLPAWFWIRRKKFIGTLGTVGIMGVTVVVYALVKHYFGAEYFTPLFDTTWVTTFFDQGFLAGVKYILWRLVKVGMDFMGDASQGIRTDMFWGEYFVAFLVVLFIILIQTVRNLYKKEEKQLTINLHLLISFVGMFAALLLMYKMKEGSKHLLTFISVGIFGISLMDTRFFKKAVATAAVFVFLFTATGVDAYEHRIPFASEELSQRESYWEEVFARECILDMEEIPDFENVMIWVFNDQIGEETITTPYQFLYQLPEGFGISCCLADYVEANLDQLQSKYLATLAGGRIDVLCTERGLREIGRDEGMVVYELYGENK